METAIHNTSAASPLVLSGSFIAAGFPSLVANPGLKPIVAASSITLRTLLAPEGRRDVIGRAIAVRGSALEIKRK